ncbi:MAG: lytic transglycosylase domain-containing protein [Desulfarculales bacterium]|nr:lytic transglycosylase domain-containing protein [Desulfarculales bacterium]
MIKAVFVRACKEMNMPLDLALAIADTESGLNPNALNIAGRSFNLSRGKAIQAAQEAQAAGKSFDIGIMQINCQWLAKFDTDIETAFDILINIKLGLWILKQEIAAHGFTWKAVARYHSPDENRGLAYARTVIRRLKPHASVQLNPARPIPKNASTPLRVVFTDLHSKGTEP